jgi:N-acetylmuramoyl-L-alanine amidase
MKNKNKFNSLFVKTNRVCGSAIDAAFWFMVWGAVVYFFLVVGAMSISAQGINHIKAKGAHKNHPLGADLIVAFTLLGEARGEGELGMYAVACVIEQRAKNRKLTLVEVCLQEKQFSMWDNIHLTRLHGGEGSSTLRKLSRSPSWAYAKKISRAMLMDKKLDQSITKNADHYHNQQVKPYWANKVNKTIKIGNHIFYKLKK